MKGLKKTIMTMLAMALIVQFFCIDLSNPKKARADVTPAEIFTDNFSSTSGNGSDRGWDPVSGKWVVENGQLKHDSYDYNQLYTQTGNTLFSTGFESPVAGGLPSDFTNIRVVSSGAFANSTDQNNGGSQSFKATAGSWTKSIYNSASALNWKDYEIDVDVLPTNVLNSSTMIHFRTNAVDYGLGYFLRLKNVASNTYTFNAYYHNGSGGIAPADSLSPTVNVAMDSTVWHHLKLRVEGSRLTVWKDNEADPVYNFLNLDVSSGAVAGTVGFGMDTSPAVSYFDNLTVKELLQISAVPPLVHRGGSETSTITISNLNPSGITSPSLTIETPSGLPLTCIATLAEDGKSASAIFPIDCGGQNTLATSGTYLVKASATGMTSSYQIEVKERPDMTFVQASDIHDNASTDNRTHNDIQSFIDRINGETFFSEPDAVVMAGDITAEGTTAQYDGIKSQLSSLGVDYFPLIGNHDRDSVAAVGTATAANNYNSAFEGKFNYTQLFGKTKLVFLSTPDVVGYDASSQVEWLTGTQEAPGVLAEAENNPDIDQVIVITHYPLTCGFRSGGGFITSSNFCGAAANIEAAVKTEIEKYSKVKVISTGHGHLNGTEISNGKIYTMTNSSLEGKEFKYYEVYNDHVDISTFPFIYNAYNATATNHFSKQYYWGAGALGSTGTATSDLYHNDASEYNYGLPADRKSSIYYSGDGEAIVPNYDLTVYGGDQWQSYEIKAKTRMATDYLGQNFGIGTKSDTTNLVTPNSAGLVARYSDAQNYYLAEIDTSQGIGVQNASIYKKVEGKFYLVDQKRMGTTPAVDTDYYLKLKTEEDSLKFYVSTDATIDESDLQVNATDSSLSAGRFGLAGYANSTFDDVSATDLGSPNAPTFSSQDNQPTNDTTPILSWDAATDPEGTDVTYDLYVDGAKVGSGGLTTTSATTGTLSEGSHSWYVVAKDTSGHETQSESRTLTIDTHAPGLANQSVAAAYTNNRNPEYSFTSNEAGYYTASAGCGAMTLNDVRAGVNTNRFGGYDPLAEGPYSCTMTVYDAAGNSADITYAFTIDTTAPALAIASPNDGVSTNGSSIALLGSALDLNPGTTLTVNGVAVLNPSNFSVSGTLSSGTNRFVFVATDAAGNTTTKTITVTRRALAPNDGLGGGISTASTPSMASVSPTETLTAPVTSQTIPSLELFNSSDNSSITASTGTNSITTQTPTLRGKTSPYATVILEFHSSTFTAQVLADKDGRWEYTPTTQLSYGEHTVKITIKAQNTNQTIAEGTYKLNIVEKAESKAKETESSKENSYLLWIILGIVVVGGGVILLRNKRK